MSDTDAVFGTLYDWMLQHPLPALGSVIGCIVLIRLAMLVAEERSPSTQPRPRRTGKRWWQHLFASRLEQLANQQNEMAARANLMRTKREALLAQTDLLKAQSELDAEIQTAKSKAPETLEGQRMELKPSLSLPQILGVLELVDLDPDDKNDLETLFRQCLNDSRPQQ